MCDQVEAELESLIDLACQRGEVSPVYVTLSECCHDDMTKCSDDIDCMSEQHFVSSLSSLLIGCLLILFLQEQIKDIIIICSSRRRSLLCHITKPYLHHLYSYFIDCLVIMTDSDTFCRVIITHVTALL